MEGGGRRRDLQVSQNASDMAVQCGGGNEVRFLRIDRRSFSSSSGRYREHGRGGWFTNSVMSSKPLALQPNLKVPLSGSLE
jgi:hypothetical protein